MTTRRGRRQLPTDGQSSRIQAIPVSQAIDLAHCPTTSHDDDQVEADPPMAQHGLRQPRGPGLQPRADDARRGHGGRPRDPGHPAVRLSAPRHPPRPHPGRTQWTPEGTDTGRPHRTPEAGHWTPGRSDTRTGHRTPITGTGTRGHRTPTRTGQRQHSRRPDVLGLLAERPHAGTPNCVPALVLPGNCWVALRARPRLGALLSSDEFRVESRAGGRPSSVMAPPYQVSPVGSAWVPDMTWSRGGRGLG
jgi:hypothetical protein